MTTAKELKRKYIEFFKTKDHKEIPSSSVFPENDPTVLFTTAGMQPLVPFLMGEKHPLGDKLVNSQKCIRTDDIDEVGDTTHHTFFEMLGNWSLGSYFKDEAIRWSFEFLTKELQIPLNKLAVTVFEGNDAAPRDDDSVNIWKELGVPQTHIAYLPKKDNWWGPAGQSGPCGPCSEMFYWVGEGIPEKFDPNNNQWVEIWNDVFMEYNKKADGSFEKLAQKNVDTGMGLERVSAVLQGKDDNYLTDLFQPIISRIEELSKKKYEDNKQSMRIIADHIKASTFILAEGKMGPSNADQGYILRRLIRRAIRHGRSLGIAEQFTSDIALSVISLYPEYEELAQNKSFILAELDKEELKFGETLENGLKMFAKITQDKTELTGEDAFLLFQSYGFPIEMSEELAKEKNISIHKEGFDDAFKKHQELSRKGAEQKFKGGLADHSDKTVKLHTATHLLNEALRKVLHEDIRQRGSNITSERLRFDFNFDRKLTDEEKQAVEKEVNRVIQEDLSVTRDELPLKDALDAGAQGEFGAKYPEVVSVYSVGDYSKEICGGPHVKKTSEIGKFTIKKEESIAAGIRRIKAVIE